MNYFPLIFLLYFINMLAFHVTLQIELSKRRVATDETAVWFDSHVCHNMLKYIPASEGEIVAIFKVANVAVRKLRTMAQQFFIIHIARGRDNSL